MQRSQLGLLGQNRARDLHQYRDPQTASIKIKRTIFNSDPDRGGAPCASIDMPIITNLIKVYVSVSTSHKSSIFD